jgi:hypothetical protein
VKTAAENPSTGTAIEFPNLSLVPVKSQDPTFADSIELALLQQHWEISRILLRARLASGFLT